MNEKDVTVINDIHLALERQQVLRRQGIREYFPTRPGISDVINGLLLDIEANHLLEPAFVYEVYPITGIDQHYLSLAGNIGLNSPLLSSVLSPTDELAIVVGTIGANLERQVKHLLDGSEPLRGLLLDGIGNAAIDSLVGEVCRVIAGIARLRGYRASSPFSPGMPGFPITEQWPLFQLVPAEEIGVSLTTTGTMFPLKSISMVIGMGQQVTVWTRAEFCAHCNLGKTCRYRFEDARKPQPVPRPGGK